MRRSRNLLGLVWRLATATFETVVVAWSIVFGTLARLRAGSLLAADFVRARWSLRGGVLRCPAGHAVETEGASYSCEACGWTYGRGGSIWLCPNVECPAPVNPFVDCPECGLSVRNPYRWGRP